MSEKKPPVRHRGETKCFLCEESIRSDRLIRHMLSHRHNLPHLLHPNCRRAAIEQKIPMMFYHGEFLSNKEYRENKNNLFCICLICEKGKYAKGHGNPEDFYRLHKDTNCMRQWELVADLFGNKENILENRTVTYVPVSTRIASLEQLLAEERQAHAAEIENMTKTMEILLNTNENLEDKLKSLLHKK